jgi:hypothetical protein
VPAAKVREASCHEENAHARPGVLLGGLALLHAQTGDASLLDVAKRIATATIKTLVYPDGARRRRRRRSLGNDVCTRVSARPCAS